MIQRVSIGVFFLFVVVLAVSADGSVSFHGTKVTLDCPASEDDTVSWEWTGNKGKIPGNKTQNYLIIYNYEDQHNGLYYCTYGTSKHYFYIRATVCENCYDLDKTLATGVMIGDVLFTLGVVLIVYLCAQKKAGKAAPQRAKQTRPQARGPAVPEPDYQPLNPGTRSNDVYASANHAV